MEKRALLFILSAFILSACSDHFKVDDKKLTTQKTGGLGGSTGWWGNTSGGSTGGTSGGSSTGGSTGGTDGGSSSGGTSGGSSSGGSSGGTSGGTDGGSTSGGSSGGGTSGGSSGGSTGPGACSDPQVDAFCRNGAQPPNVLGVLEDLARQYPGELSRCDRHNYEFSHIVANHLRANYSERWGLNWVRGNYGDETGDVIGYYYGPGTPQNNSPLTVIIDFVGACGGDERIQWGVYPPDYNTCCNPNGSVRWTIEPLGGGGSGTSGGTGACLGSGGQVRNGYDTAQNCNASWSNDPRYTPCVDVDGCWKPLGF